MAQEVVAAASKRPDELGLEQRDRKRSMEPAAFHGNQRDSSDDNDGDSSCSTSGGEASEEKMVTDDPVEQAACLEQRESHREEKYRMRSSVKFTGSVQHMAAEKSPDPRAKRERLLLQLAEELRPLPTLPANDASPDVPCEGYDDAVQLPPKHCSFKAGASTFNLWNAQVP